MTTRCKGTNFIPFLFWHVICFLKAASTTNTCIPSVFPSAQLSQWWHKLAQREKDKPEERMRVIVWGGFYSALLCLCSIISPSHLILSDVAWWNQPTLTVISLTLSFHVFEITSDRPTLRHCKYASFFFFQVKWCTWGDMSTLWWLGAVFSMPHLCFYFQTSVLASLSASLKMFNDKVSCNKLGSGNVSLCIRSVCCIKHLKLNCCSNILPCFFIWMMCGFEVEKV